MQLVWGVFPSLILSHPRARAPVRLVRHVNRHRLVWHKHAVFLPNQKTLVKNLGQNDVSRQKKKYTDPLLGFVSTDSRGRGRHFSIQFTGYKNARLLQPYMALQHI